MADSGWTSLEVAKLVVGAMTPLAVLWLGVLLNRRTRRSEALQQANQRLVAHRVEVFDQVSAKLNRLLCFATFVGRWKDITPKDAMTLKRDIDEVMYANRLLFSDELFAAYRSFILCLFAVYATVDRDALIRCGVSSRWGDRRNQAWWEPEMTKAFCTDRETTPQEAQEAYARLAAAFRADLYVDALAPGSATSVVNGSPHSTPSRASSASSASSAAPATAVPTPTAAP